MGVGSYTRRMSGDIAAVVQALVDNVDGVVRGKHHQIRMARMRGTDEGKAHIGMDIFGPEPDFAAMAKSMGVWAEGPIDAPGDIAGAVARALEVVKSGKPALVDVICRHR